MNILLHVLPLFYVSLHCESWRDSLSNDSLSNDNSSNDNLSNDNSSNRQFIERQFIELTVYRTDSLSKRDKLTSKKYAKTFNFPCAGNKDL